MTKPVETIDKRMERLERTVSACQAKDRRKNGFILLMFLAIILLGVNTVVYANHVGQKSDRHAEQLNQKTDQEVANFCELLTALDSAYQSTPPQSDLGRRVADAMHRLKTSNCG